MVYNLVKYLQTELPTLVFTADGWLPTTPEEASTVIDNGGSAPPIINRYEWAIQVLSRALDKPTAKANINIIFNQLNDRYSALELPAITVSGTVYPAIKTYQITANQLPGYVGSSNTNLEMYSVNFRITTKRS